VATVRILGGYCGARYYVAIEWLMWVALKGLLSGYCEDIGAAIAGLVIEWLLSGYGVAIKGLLSGYCEDIGWLLRARY